MVFDIILVILILFLVYYASMTVFNKHVKMAKMLWLVVAIVIVGISAILAKYFLIPDTAELLTKPSVATYLEAFGCDGEYLAISSSSADGTTWYTFTADGTTMMLRADRYSRVVALENTPYKQPVLLKCVAPEGLWRTKLLSIYYYVLVVPKDGLMWYW